MTVRIGTRGSPLALYQARAVAAALQATANVTSEIVVIKTSGDRLAEATLADIGGKRLFVKEIEDALLADEVDLAVHSSKDLPADLPDGLRIGAVLPREDPSDALVLPAAATSRASFEHLGSVWGDTPVIGTSSVRRIAQLRRAIPRARFAPVRGNLDTRLRKLDEGGYDAIVLAAAGLKRLGLTARISTTVPLDACIPAPGQGIIAVEHRVDDPRVRELLMLVDDHVSHVALRAERAVVSGLGGGCQMPIGAHAAVRDDRVILTATVVAPDGTRDVRATLDGPADHAEALGRRVADTLLETGAGEILDQVRREQDEANQRS